MEQIEGTQVAFLKLITQKNFASKFGYNRGTVSNWKRYLEGRAKNIITIDKMEEILLKHGAVKYQKECWQLTD